MPILGERGDLDMRAQRHRVINGDDDCGIGGTGVCMSGPSESPSVAKHPGRASSSHLHRGQLTQPRPGGVRLTGAETINGRTRNKQACRQSQLQPGIASSAKWIS
jgi:hypothetical protein